MNRLGKRLFALVLAAAMGLGLAACGGRTGQETEAGTAAEGGQEARAEDAAGETLTAMGRYVETTFPLPENNSYLSRAMQLLTDGSLAYFDGEYGLSVSSDEGKSWSAKASIEELFGEHPYLTSAAISPAGRLAMTRMDFSDDYNDVSVGVAVTGGDGGLQTLEGGMGDGDYIIRLFWREEELYGVSVRGKVCRIDPEAGDIKLLFTAAERPEMLAFSGTLLYALENEGVEIFGLEENVMMESDSVLDAFCAENFGGMLGANADSVGAFLLPGEEGVLYLACDKGLYRHVLHGTAMEQLIDGSFSTFGDSSVGMCSLAALESGEFLLLTTGEELVRLTYDPDEPAVPENLLTVYSLYENDRIRQAIHVFQTQHADVYVKYEIGISEGSAVTLTDALKNLNVELMSQNGPDVLLLDGIDDSVYAQKGMLKDLSDFAARTLTQENEALSNITESGGSEAGLFVLPATFRIPMLFGKQEDVEPVGDLSALADLVERLREESAAGCITGSFSAQQELLQLMSLESGGWLQEGKLDTESLTDFLTQAKRIYEANISGVDADIADMFTDRGVAKPLGNQVIFMMLEQGQLAYGIADTVMSDLSAMDSFLKQGGYVMKPWEGSVGPGFIPANKLAISATATQPERAEEFLALLFSRQMQDRDFSDGFPVNLGSFEELCRPRKEGDDNFVSFHGSWRMPDGTTMEYSYQWPEAESIEEILALAKTLEHSVEGNAYLEEAVLKYGQDALSGALGIEEAVSGIERAVAIYLAE